MNQPKISLQSEKGKFARVAPSGTSLDKSIILTNIVGNGYKATSHYFGRVIVLVTGPNKGTWREVTEVSGTYLPLAQEVFKAPSKKPTYHDHM